MHNTKFNQVHEAITEIVKDSDRKGVAHGRATEFVLRQTDTLRPYGSEPKGLHFGRTQAVEGLEDRDFDDRMATVFITDYDVSPPLTRWLVRTSVGRMAGVQEGQADDVLGGSLAEMHSDITPLGRMIVVAMEKQLQTLPQPVVTSSN